MCKHFAIHITDVDRANMICGFDIELDYCLGMEDIIEKPKIPVAKKKKKKQKRTESSQRLRESSDSSLNSTNRSNFR